MSNQAELHNKIAGEIVASIVLPPIEAGGDFKDVLVVLESVIMGVMLVTARIGGDEVVLDAVVARVKERLAEKRLGDIETAGRA